MQKAVKLGQAKVEGTLVFFLEAEILMVFEEVSLNSNTNQSGFPEIGI